MHDRQDPSSAWKHVLRLVGREVGLKEAARRLELDPWRVDQAREMFALASLVRVERLRVLVSAGLLESAEWIR